MLQEKKIIDEFIGHQRELTLFTEWLADPDPAKPWILFLHDAVAEPEKKGGVGKTWLLHRYAAAAREQNPDMAIAVVDFINTADRDGVAVARRMVDSLTAAYPTWSPIDFLESSAKYLAATGYRASTGATTEVTDRGSLRINAGELLAPLYDAFVRDLARLDRELHDKKIHLLLLFDTFEMIEQYPVIAVLNAVHPFPYKYSFTHIGAVIAGRNAPDWQHQNWQGRESEVQCVPIHPFSIDEMVQFINNNGVYAMEGSLLNAEQAQALYRRTEGRPILVGLVTDMLNHRVMSLDELIATPLKDFERSLVTHINFIEEPLNWAILFMAHIYHRFNPDMLAWILTHLTQDKKFTTDIDIQSLIDRLLVLSFVRRASTSDNIMLHDEMRRLVNTYNWTAQQIFPEAYRKDLSRIVVAYYEQQLTSPLSEQMRQIYTVELAYHKLFVDIDDGFNFASQRFNQAIDFWQNAYARAIFQEMQKFSSQFSSEQRLRMLHGEATLLRREENSVKALELYQQLEEQADENFLAQRRATIQFEKGECYQQISAFDEAIRCFNESYELEMQKENYLHAAYLLNLLGLINRRLGKTTEAENYYRESMALNRQIKDKRNYANALNSMGNLYRLQGKLDEALQYITVALQIRRDFYSKGMSSEIGIGLCLSSICLVYLKMGDLTQAQQFCEEALKIYERNTYLTGITSIYNRFGQIEIGRMRLGQALEWFNKGYAASLGVSSEEEVNSLNKQGRVFVLLGQIEEAIPFFERAASRAQEVRDVYQQLESLLDLVSVRRRLGQEQEALSLLQRTEQIARHYTYHDLLGLIEKIHGEQEYQSSQYQSAFQRFALYCYHMSQFNIQEYDAAIRYLVDALLALPIEQIAEVKTALIAYWNTLTLDTATSALLLKSLTATDLLLDA
jgi:Predicted N-acetylglucosaminyl transferase